MLNAAHRSDRFRQGADFGERRAGAFVLGKAGHAAWNHKPRRSRMGTGRATPRFRAIIQS
jgi:hypothetical protein